ncbi:MAG: SH3 domain-containing protein, partial [Gemmataceae bacterium]|nr:SH3 domain-containing protein [Gemmataceae bacterium]MDW8265179.1 SH3 domain-containing protein [Gemmataceae bacterium]
MQATRIAGGLGWVLMLAGLVRAQTAPYETVVVVPEVEIRSGPSSKFYPTAKVRQGDRLKVLREEKDSEGNDWLAIEPPPGSFSWINGRFVERTGRSAVVVGDRVPVLVGSSLTGDKPTVQQATLTRGTQLIILGDAHITDEGKWWPIQPHPPEVRYIPKSAVQVQPASVQPTYTTASSSPSNTAGGVSADPLWLQAQQAEQAGNRALAEELYTQLARTTPDHSLAMLCYNRIQHLRDGQRVSTPPNYQPNQPSVATYGDPRLVPAPSQSGLYQSQYPARPVPPPAVTPAPTPLPYQSSGPGRLFRAGFFVDGKQAYVLESNHNQPRLYVT